MTHCPQARWASAAATPSTPPTARSARWRDWSSTPARGHVTHVLLQEGHLWGRKDVAIPVGNVTRMDGGGISVSMSKDDIGELPQVDLSKPGG